LTRQRQNIGKNIRDAGYFSLPATITVTPSACSTSMGLFHLSVIASAAYEFF